MLGTTAPLLSISQLSISQRLVGGNRIYSCRRCSPVLDRDLSTLRRTSG